MQKMAKTQSDLSNNLKQLHRSVQELLNKEYQDKNILFKFNLSYNNIFKCFDITLLRESDSVDTATYEGNGYKLLYDPTFTFYKDLIQLLDTY